MNIITNLSKASKVMLVGSLFALSPLGAQAVAFDNDDFIIAGFNSNNIGVYDSDLTFKGFLDTGFSGVVGLDLLSNGNVIAAGRPDGPIKTYDSSGSIVSSFSHPDIDSPIDVKVSDGDSRIFVGTQSGTSVREFDTAGNSIRTFGGNQYDGVAVLPGNILWAGGDGNPGIIDVYDLTTNLFLSQITLDNGQGNAESMFFSALTNTVLLTDTTTGDVFERALDGTFIRRFIGPGAEFGVTRGPNGDVYATSCGTNQVTRWQSDGTFVSQTATGLSCAVGIVYTGNVPEPATLALMGLGLVGIGWRRKVSSS